MEEAETGGGLIRNRFVSFGRSEMFWNVKLVVGHKVKLSLEIRKK